MTSLQCRENLAIFLPGKLGGEETGLVESEDCIIMQTSAGGGQTLGSQATSAGKI